MQAYNNASDSLVSETIMEEIVGFLKTYYCKYVYGNPTNHTI